MKPWRVWTLWYGCVSFSFLTGSPSRAGLWTETTVNFLSWFLFSRSWWNWSVFFFLSLLDTVNNEVPVCVRARALACCFSHNCMCPPPPPSGQNLNWPCIGKSGVITFHFWPNAVNRSTYCVTIFSNTVLVATVAWRTVFFPAPDRMKMSDRTFANDFVCTTFSLQTEGLLCPL